MCSGELSRLLSVLDAGLGDLLLDLLELLLDLLLLLLGDIGISVTLDELLE